jgi:hypothetical protein
MELLLNNFRATLSLTILLFFLIYSCTEKQKKENEFPSSNTNEKSDTIKEYYEAKTLKHIIPLKNGKRNGLCKWYYPSGTIKTIANYTNGIETGETIYYNPEGRIENYNFFDLKGNLRFDLTYDSLGKIINREGKSLYLIKDFANNESSNIKRIVIKAFVATPPNTEITLEFKDIKNNLTSIYKITDEKKYPLFATQCLSTEECSFMVISNIKNLTDNLTIIDTAFYNQNNK